MNKFFKRLALLLAVLMIVSMMPVQLFADNSVAGEEQSNGTGENSYLTISGIAGFEDRQFASFADAYTAIKPALEGLCEKDALGQGVATAGAFDALFTNRDENGNATLTYTISGNVVYDETGYANLLTMGRRASHYGNDRHLINFKFVGATGKDADTLTVNSNITLPYEWWGEKTVTSISFENLTITGSAPNGLYPYQSFFEGINFKVDNCNLKGIKIYNCSNVKGTYTITNSTLDGIGTPADAYAIHLQGNETEPLTINISGNTISGFDRGINIDQKTANATISDNTISIKDAGRSCIQLSSLTSTVISNNTLELTGGNAITLHENLLTLTAVPEISVDGNTITGNGYLIYDDAVANSKAFTSENLTLTIGTNTVASTVDTTQGVKGSDKFGLSETVATVVKDALTPAYVATVNGTGYASLAEAIAAAQNGDTIYVSAGEYTTYGNTSPKKSLTFVGAGAGNTIWTIGDLSKNVGGEGNGDYSFDGCDTITFKNMTLKSNSDDYRGFIRVSNTIVENCTLEGKTAYWGYNTATFTGCTFNAPEGDYALWDYSTKTMTFDGCEFNISGKGVNVYVEAGNAGSEARKVEAKDCTINSTKANKAFLNIKNKTQAYEVTLSGNNKVNGLDANSTTGSSLYQVETTEVTETSGKTVKVQEKATDGTLTTVYEVKAASTAVAMVGGVEYASLAEAIAAATRNSTVKLLADTRENVTIDKQLTLDLNGHTLNGGTVKAKPALTITARVTVKDSSAAQTGTIMREDTAENSGVSSHYVIDIQGNAWVMFESGIVKNNSGTAAGKGASLVRVGNDSVEKYPGLNIKGGSFTQDNFIVIKVDRGDLFLNGGTLNSTDSYAVENWHRATIKGGTVNGAVSSWTYSGGLNSTLEISGGTVNGNVESVSYDGSAGKKAKVSITGGTVNGTLIAGIYNSMTEPTKDMATIEVTGGTFTKDPTKYLVEGSTVTPNSDGTFGVAKAYLAKVGDTSYYTMDEAFKAQTASGKPIVLLRDYTTGSTFNSGTVARVVDLNGHTWTCTGTDANSAAFEINNPNASLTVKNGKIVSSQLVGLIPSANGGTIKYDNSSLTFENVQMSTTATSGIETNGNNTNDTVKLVNSTLNVPNGFGIYFPSSGELIIENSKITAKTMGVQVCAGSLSINEGSAITVTGDAVEKTENDGAIQDGAAISIVNRTGYKGLGTVTVSGGKFTAKKGNSAIKAYNWENNTESKFTAREKVAVSGGTFSSAVPEEYCAEGFIPTKNEDGTYGVKEGKYVAQIGDVKYETLADAIAAANDGDTITLLADINTPEKTYEITKNLTIDLNGKTVTGSGYDGVFEVTGKNIEVVLNATNGGKVIAVENSGSAGKYAMAVWMCGAGSKLTINGGEFIQNITSTDDKQMDMIYASAGTIIINSGSFTSGTPKWTLNINDSAYKAGTANIIVNGGTFTGYDPRNAENEGKGTSLVADGVGIDKNADGTFTAKSGMAAQIVDADGNSVAAYTGLYDAIKAAKDGETVILLSDRKNFVTNTVNANITIDLNGKTLSLGNNNPFFCTNGEVTIQNGTIDTKSTYACVIVNAYNKLTLKNVKITGVTGDNGKNLVNVCSNAEVTIDKDTVLTASGSNGAAVFIGQDADAKYTLNVYGKVIQESKSFAISGNGSYKGTTTINIYDGAEVKSASVAIYHPQAGVINVNGGLVEGYCAIGIKSGTLNINGGTVRGTADDHVLDDSNSTSGTIIYDGSAIIVDSRSTGYAGNVNINVTGGTVESYYSTAIREIGEQDKPNMTQLTKLNITGGSVLGANQQLGNVTNDMLVRDISSSNVSVSGGTFNHAVPDSYCADGFIPTKNADGTYGVKEGKYVAQIGNVKYETLAEAVEAAKNGDTITLLEDCKSGRINLENKSVTVALNGKTLTSTAANGVMFCAKNGNKITIDGTVEGSKLVGTLMITAGTDGHIEVNGGTYESSLYCPIYVNGAVNSENSTVTVKNAIINATNSNSNQDMGCGVYLAGYSTSVFENCTITAPITGIEIRAGKLTLNNCDVTGGNGEVKTKANGNGTTVTNAALAISQHTTKKPIEVIINGGTFNGTAAVYQTDVQDTGSVDVKIAVKNGTFNGTISGETDGTIAISGGKFKFKVDDKYFADKLACSATPNADGYYTVKDHPIISAGISISEDMSFRIIVGKGYENGKLKYYYDTIGEDNTIVRVEGEGILGTDTKGNSIFRIYNVNPQRADLIYVIQYYDADGNAVGAPKEISVLTYFEGFYNMEAGKNEDVDARKTFIANFLEYCASAMERSYTQYEDVKLNGKTWQDRADAVRAMMTRLGLEATDYEFKGNLGRYFKDNSEGIILKRGVVFGSTFKAYYQISKEAIDNGYKVFRQGMDVTDKLELVDGAYRLYFELAPYEFKDNLTITVYNGTTKVCEYTSPLANTLEVLSKSTDASLANMAKAAFNYFVALQNYNG